MNRIVVELVRVQGRSHKERVFVLLCVTVPGVKASLAVSCVVVCWAACAVVWGTCFVHVLGVLISEELGLRSP